MLPRSRACALEEHRAFAPRPPSQCPNGKSARARPATGAGGGRPCRRAGVFAMLTARRPRAVVPTCAPCAPCRGTAPGAARPCAAQRSLADGAWGLGLVRRAGAGHPHSPADARRQARVLAVAADACAAGWAPHAAAHAPDPARTPSLRPKHGSAQPCGEPGRGRTRPRRVPRSWDVRRRVRRATGDALSCIVRARGVLLRHMRGVACATPLGVLQRACKSAQSRCSPLRPALARGRRLVLSRLLAG